MTKKKRRQLSEVDINTAMIIAIYVRNEMEDFHCEHLSDAQMKELNPIIRNAIATALYGIRNYTTDEACRKLMNFQEMFIPKYWEQPQLTESFHKFVKYLESEEAKEAESGE
ncbi:MAG: hypothetical protein KME10_18020 [Plectolyngbya sp. WJT66-NPBG17]|jgi:hypothetical protein|nr:hypothetical protein [Plectolyngbya sp. WJT66-NPBG17]